MYKLKAFRFVHVTGNSYSKNRIERYKRWANSLKRIILFLAFLRVNQMKLKHMLVSTPLVLQRFIIMKTVLNIGLQGKLIRMEA